MNKLDLNSTKIFFFLLSNFSRCFLLLVVVVIYPWLPVALCSLLKVGKTFSTSHFNNQRQCYSPDMLLFLFEDNLEEDGGSSV